LGDRPDPFARAQRPRRQWRGRLVRRALPAAAAGLCVLALAPAGAHGAETVISFDEGGLANGTALMGKTIKGVTFGESPLGPFFYGGTVRKTQEASEAHSPPNVLETSRECTENPHSEIWGRFAAPRSHVALFLGNIKPNPLTAIQPVTLQGFDLNGNEITSHKVTPPKSYGVATELAIDDPFERITFFKLVSVGPAECPVAIDDLSFNAFPVEIPPEIGISAQTIGTTVAAGSSVNVTLQLHRTATSTGPVSLGVSGLPSGVGASISPNPTNGPDLSTMTLMLSAGAQAPPAVNVPVTVTATPSPTAGSATHTTTFPLSVSGNFDLRAQGMEVTQAVQPAAGRLVPSGGESGGSYNGVPLVAHKRTVVRFFADAHGAETGSGSNAGGIPGVGAELVGDRNGIPLPGSPLYADSGPASLKGTHEADPAPVLAGERASEANAYTFTLPTSWASGTIQLVARVLGPPPSFGPALLECTAASCIPNNSFTENNVAFGATRTVELWTVALAVEGELASEQPLVAQARQIYPLPEPGWDVRNPNSGFFILPYQGVIDITDALKAVHGSNIEGERGERAKALVSEWASDMGNPGIGTIGIAETDVKPALAGFRSVEGGTTAAVIAHTDAFAHELGHLFGLQHASNECGGGGDGDSDDEGQSGTPWPLGGGVNEDALEAGVPGNKDSDSDNGEGFGELLGVGLDFETQPYTLLANGLNGVPDYFDVMSYCHPSSLGPNGLWISPINWEAVLRRVAAPFGSSTRAGTAAAPASAAQQAGRVGSAGPLAAVASLNPSRLRVVGYAGATGFHIRNVGPAVGPRLPAGSSPFSLTAVGAGGRVLATVPMALADGHADGAGPLDEVSAEVPARGVEAIQISKGGVLVDSRTRPARRPRAVLLAPASGAKVGKARPVVVRWRASSPEHLRLTAALDYSRDDGRSWRTVFLGGSHGRATLPAILLAASRRARLRLRVSDGFNETTVVSRRFTALGAPPEVTIASTLKTIAGDATLPLAGEAFDQSMHMLAGRSLRWLDGPFALGTGTSIAAGPLPPGTNRIRLVARDSHGRTAQALVTVEVQPVVLPFLKLGIPHRVSRRARTLAITANSSVPASLTIAGKTVSVRSGASRLNVRIPASSRPLLLRCSVVAAGRNTPFAVAVARG
jgi:hypothetical protein